MKKDKRCRFFQLMFQLIDTTSSKPIGLVIDLTNPL